MPLDDDATHAVVREQSRGREAVESTADDDDFSFDHGAQSSRYLKYFNYRRERADVIPSRNDA
ncbi:MAG: hypothetical protein ACJ8R9_03860 [Steroidobacteraceae bacterium]